MATQIKLRRDTYQNWYDNNPILGLAEPGFDTTNKKLKIGDGTTAWRDLAYFDDQQTDLTTVAQNIIPDADNTRDIGSPDRRWRHGYFATGSLYVGDIKLSNSNGQLIVQQVTDAGLITEAPVPDTPGVVTTDRIINGSHSFSIDADGFLFLDGEIFTSGGGVSISDFGDGFGLDNASKIVTNKLYSTNLTNSNQHYRLELDTNGVVHLPDQSIINGATLRVVPGTGELNYAALAAGPDVDHPEQTWIWADANGAWITTNSYTNGGNTWWFNNNGVLTLPAGGDIQINGQTVLGGGGSANTGNITFDGDTISTEESVIEMRVGSEDQYSNMYMEPASWEAYADDNSGDNEAWAWIRADMNDGNTSPKVFVETRSSSTDTSKRWTFDADGALTFPDGTVQTTAYTGVVTVADTAPANAEKMWFNSEEGRLYVRYNNQWVDASPVIIPLPERELEVDSVEFADATVQTTAWPGTLSYNDLTNKPEELAVVDGGNAYTWAGPV